MSVTPGVYRHYKGNHYLVIGRGTHTETGEALVVYVPLYWPPVVESKGPFFVRPASMWSETVQTEDGPRVRFVPVASW